MKSVFTQPRLHWRGLDFPTNCWTHHTAGIQPIFRSTRIMRHLTTYTHRWSGRIYVVRTFRTSQGTSCLVSMICTHILVIRARGSSVIRTTIVLLITTSISYSFRLLDSPGLPVSMPRTITMAFLQLAILFVFLSGDENLTDVHRSMKSIPCSQQNADGMNLYTTQKREVWVSPVVKTNSWWTTLAGGTIFEVLRTPRMSYKNTQGNQEHRPLLAFPLSLQFSCFRHRRRFQLGPSPNILIWD